MLLSGGSLFLALIAGGFAVATLPSFHTARLRALEAKNARQADAIATRAAYQQAFEATKAEVHSQQPQFDFSIIHKADRTLAGFYCVLLSKDPAAKAREPWLLDAAAHALGPEVGDRIRSLVDLGQSGRFN